ncbi:hypothetical protein [Halorarius litoreus]|uniref:hypothetical protein n=1 Tax=Halorarius litoreus TaxID=2962676 RepID=UPI0020CE2DB7|nr:hypothetical protein [Halorarius litoreus]
MTTGVDCAATRFFLRTPSGEYGFDRVPSVTEAFVVFLVATLTAAAVGTLTGDPLTESLTRGLVVGAAVALVFYYTWERRHG